MKSDLGTVKIFAAFFVVVILLVLISRATNIDFFWLFMGLAAVAWPIMHYYEKKWRKELGEEPSVIYCEWESKLNLTDFKLSENTVLDLEALGFTPESALGEKFVFHTEPSLEFPDYYFDGTIIKDNSGNFLVRSSKEIPTK